jgi:hypothetical protein
MTRTTTLLITGIIATTFLTGCNDARRLYDGIEVGQTLDLPPAEFDGEQTVAGVGSVRCLEPRVYGAASPSQADRHESQNVDRCAFILDANQTIVAKLYLNQRHDAHLDLALDTVRVTHQEQMGIELLSAASSPNDTPRRLLEHLMDLHTLDDAEIPIDMMFVHDDAFWDALQTRGEVEMSQDPAVKRARSSYLDDYHRAAGRRELDRHIISLELYRRSEHGYNPIQ